MTRRHNWFLPQSPDVLGMLARQSKITVDGMDAFVAWASGDPTAAKQLRRNEHRADAYKRELRIALTEAFSTPLEPEDIFGLSVGLDDILNAVKDIVGEAEAMGFGPDEAIKQMADQLAAGTRHVTAAISRFGSADRTGATELADKAVKDARHLSHTYRTAMSAVIDAGDIREIAARRELYRRLARTGDTLVRVAERVWYSLLKEA